MEYFIYYMIGAVIVGFGLGIKFGIYSVKINILQEDEHHLSPNEKIYGVIAVANEDGKYYAVKRSGEEG